MPAFIHGVINDRLSNRFQMSLTQGQPLLAGIQRNDKDCGLFAINSIAHATLNEPLWEQPDSSRYRVEWFLRLAEEFRVKENTRMVEV